MERLTERDEFGNANIIGVESEDLQINLEFNELNLVTDALNKLAAYEDTGMEPSEILTGLELANVFAAVRELKCYKDAEEQGLLVRLPCKPGNCFFAVTKQDCKTCEHYILFSPVDHYDHCDCYCEECPLVVGEFELDVEEITLAQLEIISSGIGKTVFLTYEEAEAALEKMEEN